MRLRSALKSAVKEYTFSPPPQFSKDVEIALSHLFDPILDVLKTAKKDSPRTFGLKFQVRVKVYLNKFSQENNKFMHITVWFPSENYNVFTLLEINRKLQIAVQKVLSRYDSFVQKGSGWILRKIQKVSVTVNRFKLFRGGCKLQKLPQRLTQTNAILSVENSDTNKCFLYAVASSLAKVRRNASRLNADYNKILATFPVSMLKFPSTIIDVKIFERLCPSISINIYGFDKILFPCYISDKERPLHVDLLLHKHHFYAIRNMSALVSSQTKVNRRKAYLCKFCLAYFITKSKFNLHMTLCKKDGQQISMPNCSSNKLKFSNFKHLVEAPFVIYCDLETLISDEIKVQKGKVKSRREHVPISVGALTICKSNFSLSSSPFIYTGKDCIQKLFDFLHAEFMRIEYVLSSYFTPMVISELDVIKFENTDCCFMCKKNFSENPYIYKVRDHDHLNGHFRYVLCNSCNLTHAKTYKDVYVFFHGLSNYDSHFIIQQLQHFPSSSIRIIPKTSEKYLSFSLGNLYFKDSYQFLGASLAQLANNLKKKGREYFKCMAYFIKNSKKREVFFRKGVFPYSYINSPEVLNETTLPAKEKFTSDLTDLAISDEEYKFALHVWEIFECKTIKDYMEVYLLCDVMLLADVFENFRSNCLSDYEIDPSYYFSTPHFTFDAFLRKSDVSLELLTDINQYLFLSQGIRGGLSVISQRYSVANHKSLSFYDKNKPSVHILYLDANNLYGRAMLDYLPCGNFEWVTELDQLKLQYFLKVPDDSCTGYIIECDFDYPIHLHNFHCDYPLAPSKNKISYSQLSSYAKRVCDKHKLKSSVNTEKLMATLTNKNHYILHYRTLQLYVRLGLVVTKIHRVLKFKQAPIMRSYIEFNSAKRAAAINDFDIGFFKLLSNSLFGKTIERPDKRARVVLANNRERCEKLTGSLNFKSSKIINNNLVGITLSYPCIKMDKPFYIGMVILELAKFYMYDFHYNVMKKTFGDKIKLLYTDTDSLMYEIHCSDLNCKLKSISQHFDFSNLPPNHILYSPVNKRVPGKFKDECGGKNIAKFVGLRSKMYSFIFDGGENKEIKIAKGIKKAVIESKLKFYDYVQCLTNNLQFEHSFKTILSKSHSVFTSHQSKISLSPFDDKRYLIDNIFSVPYGHWQLRKNEAEISD